MSVEEIKKQMNDLIVEVKSHSDLLNSISDVLTNSIKKSEENRKEQETKISAMQQETSTIETKIQEQKTIIEESSSKLSEITPKFDAQKQIVQDLKSGNYDLDTQLKKLKDENKDLEMKVGALKAELNEKSAEKANLVSEIDTKVDSNMAALRDSQNKYDEIGLNYAALDYIFNKMETPELEILAVIASNRPISVEGIKSQAKSVQPVFVSRTISKLEADGKIIQVGEDWDLDPSLANKL